MPFGLRANVAAGLASLFSIAGGVVMLGAGARNGFVRWSAAQAIVLWSLWFALWALFALFHLAAAGEPHWPYGVIDAAAFAGWTVATVGAFSGRTVRVPVVAAVTRSLFGSLL